MATMNPTVVEKTMDDLTNQETITSIFDTFAEVTSIGYSCQNCNVDLAVAILNNPDGMEIVKWLMPDAEGRSPGEEDLAAFLADFITAVRVLPTPKGKPTKATHKEKPKEAVKTFVPPPAKLLIFNLKGKAVEDIDSRDDWAYLAKKGFSSPCVGTDLVPHMQLTDWCASNNFKSEEERDKALNALWAFPNAPRWVVRLQNRWAKEDNPDKPTPPAA